MNSQILTVKAGPHARKHTPLSFEIGAGTPPGRLTRRDTGKVLPCQVLDGKLHFILDRLGAGEQCELAFEAGNASRSRGVRLKVVKGDGKVDVTVRGKPFTTYQYRGVPHRPYFYPFLGPGGVQITRHYPMRDDIEGESHDHPHQRSVWFAFGDVNGVDNWTETEESGFQVPRGEPETTDGPVQGGFGQLLDWQDKDHGNVMAEARRVVFYNTPDNARVMDASITFTARYGSVTFGDTKEGGICSVRVAATMDAAKGGRFENSFGGINDDEGWGKSAHWCDYSGPCEGRHVGIAVFDHPMNLRHPTPWHVRSYGLMCANPFGHSYYKSSLLEDGSYRIEQGESLAFNYRLYIHDGDAAKGNVRDRYHDYINPPAVEAAG